MATALQRGVTDTEVVFGISVPLTGTAKEDGRQQRLGIEAAFAEANEAGGVAGRKVRLVTMDDAYEVPRAQAAIRELVERHQVLGIAQSFGTAAVEAVLPYVIENRVFYFAPLTGCAAARNDPPDRYVFNYRPSYAEEIMTAIRYLVNVRRIQPGQIAAFLQQDGAGDSAWAGIARQMRRFKYDPSRVIRVGYQRNTFDVDEAVRIVRQNASRLRAVVMLGDYGPSAKFIEKLRAADVNLIFTNTSVVSANELAERLIDASPAYAEGVIVTQVVPSPTSAATAILRYQKALKRYAPNERPNYLSLEAWIGGNILLEALRRAGRDLTSEGLIDAMENLRNYDLGLGTTINYGPSEHQGSHKVWGTMLTASGTYRPIDLE